MQTAHDLEMLRSSLADLRAAGARRVALVPTMGALHEGHLSLVSRAHELADAVVVSIFVNPRQFGANEDLDAYPRQLARDAALLEAAGVSLLWAPDAAAVYPPGYATAISVAGVSEGLCGAARPGHFDGVATVVCKLFNQVMPDLAVFGEKDWQQLAVIRRMARDLDLTRPAADAILGSPIVREPDGLAMSSRNAYLAPADRTAAAALPAAMRRAVARFGVGERAAGVLADLTRELSNAGFTGIDYVELRRGDTLAATDTAGPGVRLFVAARIAGVRLIDNMAVSGG